MDYREFRILHPHGDEWVEMRRQHDPAQTDPERTWGKGSVIYKCTRCDEGIVVVPPTDPQPRR
ncbi:MAG: hypothetical protein ABSD62_06110 [Candidatus Limnocylindrales bacterium]|jgi:predicted SprT family Zn-dependent metalloprotease